MDINETEKRKTIEKSMEPKSGSLKTEKPFNQQNWQNFSKSD